MESVINFGYQGKPCQDPGNACMQYSLQQNEQSQRSDEASQAEGPSRSEQCFCKHCCTLLTLFRPATDQVRAKGVLSAPNAILHPWSDLAMTLRGLALVERATLAGSD
jgi:hypothetical protein